MNFIKIKMEKNINNKFLTKNFQSQTKDKFSNNKSPLFSKTYFHNHLIKKPFLNEIKNTIIQNEEDNKKNNLEKSISLLKLFSSKSLIFEPKNGITIPEVHKKGKTCSFRSTKNLYPIKSRKSSSNLSDKNNYLYLTSSLNNSKKSKKLKIFKSLKDLNNIKKVCKKDNKKDNMIDLIHDKEINVCLDLIKSIHVNKRNKENGLNNINNYKSQETDDLIKMIKKFNIDNITNQRIIESQINKNKNLNPKIYPLNSCSLSTTTNYKSNQSKINDMINNITFYKNNKNNYINSIKNHFISPINNNDSIINYIEDNININNNHNSIINNSSTIINKVNESSNLNNNSLSFYINDNIAKKKMIKSTNNNINNKSIKSLGRKISYDPKSDINFQTGFVRSQQKIFENTYEKFYNNKRNPIKVEEFSKRKKEQNVISLPEIEEYKSIIKEIKLHKNKTMKNSKSVYDINKDNNELASKDRLIEELNNMFINQKNIFLHNLKENYGDHVRKAIDIHKEIINKNIQEINKNQRKPNIYVDGYSLLDCTINKKIKDYNYILGNKFHDKNEKEKKAEIFEQISNELQNNIKNNEDKLLHEKERYDQYFIQKLHFNNEKLPEGENLLKDDKLNLRMYKLKVFKGNHTIGSQADNKIDEPKISENDRIYKEFLNFKNDYKNRDY